jgi:GAF domain
VGEEMETTRLPDAPPHGLARARKVFQKTFTRSLSTVVLPLIIAATTAIASYEHGPVRVYWSIATVATVLITGVVAYTKDRNTSTLRDEAIGLRTELATALNDTGRPLVAALGRVTSSSTPEISHAALEVLIDRAVSLAQTEIGSQADCKTRAAFYGFEGDRLVRRSYAGWTGAHAPRQEWVLGRSNHDDEVIKFAHGEDALIVRDLENDPPPHFVDAKGRSYKSFVAVPVSAGERVLGLLTADADRAYALSDVDRGFLILIAGALGAGLAHVEVVELRATLTAPVSRSTAEG